MDNEQTSQEKSTSEQLSAVLGTLTTDQIRFVVARQECATDKEAAEAINVKPNTVYKWKAESPIDDAVRLMAMDGLIVARELRRRNLAKAMAVKVSGLDSAKEQMRQSVATEIIEWEMGRATQKQEVSGPEGGPIVVGLEDVLNGLPGDFSAAVRDALANSLSEDRGCAGGCCKDMAGVQEP